LTKDVEIIAGSWHTTIIKGMWTFFIPTAIASFLTGIIYHYWFNSRRLLLRKTVILHFFLLIFGILFSMNIYRLIIVFLNSGSFDTAEISWNSLILIFLGPILLIASLIVFIIGLLKAKRTIL
jgi:hypothetical protein